MLRRPLCLLLLLAAGARAENASEDAFRSAIDWTVQVRTSVSQPFAEDEQGTWFGAGLLVDAGRGWILTNAHVAGRSYGKVSIAFQDGRNVPARRVYVDPYLDLAVLAFDPRRLPAKSSVPVLDCGPPPPVGHPVGAFGHPWGFRYTGTRGITSAVTTRLGTTMLQTDAPINEGNSGGPLISLETGRVVGINAAKIKEQAVEGLSFAVPIRYACTVLELLKAGRDPSPPARLVDFAMDENDEQTMVVARSRLPAGSLDLRVGDTIESLPAAATGIATQSDLMDALRGQTGPVTLRIERDGKGMDIQGSWPTAPMVTERRGLSISGALFAEAEPLTRGLVAGPPTLMVHFVDPGSEAESAGILAYDMLVSADHSPVDSLETLLQRAHAAAAADRPLELVLLQLTSEVHEELFIHQRRLLPVEEPHIIGP